MTHQQQKAFENIMGKGEIARNERFLPFPTMFSTQINVSPFVHSFDIILSLFAAEFQEPNIGISGKGLNVLLSNPKV